MSGLIDERFYEEIAGSTAGIARVVMDADLTRQVPTCPDWTLRQLATHVGRGQRWAAEIVRTRSGEFIPFRSVPDGKAPQQQGDLEAWLLSGGHRLIDALRQAGADQVWTLVGMGPASFWARRMAHETVMHRIDAELTAGRDVGLAADFAADAIDELLSLLGKEDAEALGDGQVLHIHATDEGLDGAGEWLVRRSSAGLSVASGHGKGDIALRGPAAALLLVLVRRRRADDPAIEILGDRALLTRWLERTPY
jgi:uncharacterized protein (TIGR03083 family)